MIDFEHVSKEYKKGGRLALEDINFHVDEGEFVFLLGHSGAGKSTLLKLILREALPTSGKVTVLGKDVAKPRRHKIPYLRRQMGIIFQDFRLIPSIQDEAHRFAIEYHRSLRAKGQVKSILDDIPDIGPARRKALMRQFQSLEAVKEATLEALMEVPGMNRKSAESVYQFFH